MDLVGLVDGFVFEVRSEHGFVRDAFEHDLERALVEFFEFLKHKVTAVVERGGKDVVLVAKVHDLLLEGFVSGLVLIEAEFDFAISIEGCA